MTPVTKEIPLDQAIARGEQTIDTITLRKPAAGELRGVALTDLLQLDVAALQKVLPRISMPTITEQDVARMDPADLVQMGTAVAGFLLPKSAREEQSPAE